MVQEIELLKSQMAQEKAEGQREVADKDREKVQETDKLKRDMTVKIGETESSLKALKKE